MENNPSSSRIDRKEIESQRRKQMKALYHKLNSLLPYQTSKASLLSLLIFFYSILLLDA